jgi:quercetin dioxygenase-like cupin family protein
MRLIFIAFATAVACFGAFASSTQRSALRAVTSPLHKPMWIKPGDARWQAGPPSLEPGAKSFVLEGDLTQKGPFVIRVSLPKGFRIMPHVHGSPERVTVISGTYALGLGSQFDASKLRDLPAGSYAYTPDKVRHFAMAKSACVIQIHGVGPWSIEYLNPKDDPRKRGGK